MLLMVVPFTASYAQAPSLDIAKNQIEGEQYEEAKATFSSLIKTEPNNANIYYYYGECYVKAFYADTVSSTKKDVIKQATALFQKGLSIDPQNPLNHIGVGLMSMFQGDSTSAGKKFREAIALLPKFKKTKKVPYSSLHGDVFLKVGEAYLITENKYPDKTVKYLEIAKEYNAINPQIFIVEGDAYLEMNDGSKAMLNYNQAQTVAPTSALAKIKSGAIYLRAKNAKAAIPYYEAAIKVDPKFAPVYRSLGELNYKIGKYEESKKYYKTFLELSGSNNIPAKISYIVSIYSGKDYEEVIKQCQEVLAVDNSRNLLNRLIAYSYLETKQLAKAAPYMEKFLKAADPDFIIAKDYKCYGMGLTEMNRDTLAVEQFRKALAMEPTNYSLYLQMYASAYKAKNYGFAASFLEKRMTVVKPEIADYKTLGKTYYTGKLYTKADSVFGKMAEVATSTDDKIFAYTNQAYSRVQLDTTAQGIAVPAYQALVKTALTDSAKYTKNLVDAYSYLGYFNLSNSNVKEAKVYYQKILAIEPTNEKAVKAMDALNKGAGGKKVKVNK